MTVCIRSGVAEEGQRFNAAQLRAALSELAGSHRYLNSDEGAVFVLQLEHHLVPSMINRARRVGIDGSWIHKHDVVNSVLLGLCDQGGRVARHIADAAHEPWGYLAKCSAAWVHALWGSRDTSIESPAFIAPSLEPEEGRLTRIQDVARLTYALLAPHTETRLRRQLLPLLQWLAINPPQRISHELSDRAAAGARFTDFSPDQIAVVANIAWGSRPRRRETSIMAAFLVNPDFLPTDSPSHARALLYYRRAMRSSSLSRSRSLISDYPAFPERRAA